MGCVLWQGKDGVLAELEDTQVSREGPQQGVWARKWF